MTSPSQGSESSPLGPNRRAIVLERYDGTWPQEDPDAGFRRMVFEYSRLDPLVTLETLSRNKGIPLGALVNFVLARYAASGSEALLEMGPQSAASALVRARNLICPGPPVGSNAAPSNPVSGRS